MNKNNKVIIEKDNGVGWITLNRPDALNALSWEMVHTIYDQLESFENDTDISLVCITSTHEDAFCVGGDVKEVYNHVIEGDTDYAANYLSKEYLMDYKVHTYHKPIVVYMNGLVMGGGAGLSNGCDYRIVNEKTKWSMPELQIGFFPDVAASYFLNNFPGYTGRYLALTANLIDGVDLMYLGGADYLLRSDQWPALKEEIKQTQWNTDTCNENLKQILDNYCETNSERSKISKIEDKINKYFSFNTIEQIVESLEEDANHRDLWAQETLDRMVTFPPTSMKVTLELMKRGQDKKLMDCFKMDLDLSMNIVQSHNFKEGIRSVLVDKDKKFNWSPLRANEVSQEDVDSYFVYKWKDGKHPLG
ncbi:enoyl-CoA hydratase/isomerase family protein [Haloplasma contractile]|uniref:3-hydroxyisobutyryl-CoA hydrolase n=1 Tax=Haloplasma contractile SSD-17B TaxID=1033810 RepID=F7Q0W8_9MOLU|nr:enoyl-CoA hydratase/isomerase family protein [Haloplasma contractile]ERJ11346.1 Enoyl-CoA hydratase-isomerase family protein [Haloplasma contractile SSD-17B]